MPKLKGVVHEFVVTDGPFTEAKEVIGYSGIGAVADPVVAPANALQTPTAGKRPIRRIPKGVLARRTDSVSHVNDAEAR